MGCTPELKLGVVGGGITSAVGRAHYAASRLDGRFVYKAGCFSREKTTNLQSASRYRIEPDRIYGSLDEMLDKEREGVDAILILTPTPSHFEDARKCLRAGFPVICEKSLAMTHEEARELEGLVQSRRAFLAVTYNYTGYPLVREIRNMVARGDLGRILHFRAEMPQEGYLRVDRNGIQVVPQSWRLASSKLPVLYLDLALHLHHLLCYVLGRRASAVIANHRCGGWFPDVVDNVQCLAEFGQGEDLVQGDLWFSKSSLGCRNGLRLRCFGTKASVDWMQAFPEEMHLAFQDGTRKTIDRGWNGIDIADEPRYCRFKSGHPAGYIEAFANLYNDIADSLEEYRRTGRWESSEVADAGMAAEGLAFIEKMADSARDRQWKTVQYHSDREH